MSVRGAAQTECMDRIYKIIPVVLAGLMLVANAPRSGAESRRQRDSLRHEVRVGWGDQMFERLVWQNPQYIVRNMPEEWSQTGKEHYRYSQHWFAEYQWRVNRWFGLGATVDCSGVVWDNVTRNGLGNETGRERGQNFWNLTMMPTCRFTWFNSQYVSLYSSLGAGLGINGGTETDARGRHTLCGLALDIALVGVTVDWKSWCVFAEVGGLSSVRNVKTTVFMLGSRMISVGAGFRF